jgi:acetylornithine deacetylase/succinyl-diaminopimelate desuccinylase-like protein
LKSGKPSGVHGVDEHMEIKKMEQGIRRMVRLLEIFGGQEK